MSNASDFIVKNGVLKKYLGPGGDVVIPEGVTSIGDKAFYWNLSATSVFIPEGVTSIQWMAFSRCNLLTKMTIPGSVVCIGEGAFQECANLVLLHIIGKVERIEADAFKDCYKLTDVFSPNIQHAVWRELKLGMQAAAGFITHFEAYHDPAIIDEYVRYLASQKKKLLPQIFQNDHVEILRLLADAKIITEKNIEQEYRQPAAQCKAEKCTAFLNSLFTERPSANSKTAGGKKAANGKGVGNRKLWDGIHFSLDGKKLLKYAEEPGQTVYEVPEGTKEIGKEAFFMTPLEQIILPKSVTTLRNGAFTARGGKPLFVRLPDKMVKLPTEVFEGGYFGIDDQDSDWTKYYYISTPVKKLAEDLCMDSYSKGSRYMIYTGGPLDDLPPKTKKYAVLGFLFAVRTGVEDMTAWRDSYLAHIINNEKTYVKLAAEDDYLFHFMLDEALLSEKGTKTLLSAASEAGQTDRKAELLTYQEKHFPRMGEENLTLSDSAPELKRVEKMAARREEIARHKGIRGITFVATGYFENFGEFDEYTGSKDMIDLKAYIEKLGGFLRSAVSSKTDYLICNDPNSNSVKSIKAKELGVPIITEEEFLKMAGEKE